MTPCSWRIGECARINTHRRSRRRIYSRGGAILRSPSLQPAIALIALVSACSPQREFREITLDGLQDKIEGGWVGK